MKTNLDLELARTAALEGAKSAREGRDSESERRYAEDRDWLSELWKYTLPASVADYNVWLTGFLARGGELSHFYDYPMDRHDWYVASIPFALRPLYGALSINIIVPTGVTVTGATGHSSLYFLEDFTSRGFHDQPASVPVYSDSRIVE